MYDFESWNNFITTHVQYIAISQYNGENIISVCEHVYLYKHFPANTNSYAVTLC